MGKPITIDVQAKLALKNQTDVIKGFVDGIDNPINPGEANSKYQ